MRKSRKLGDIDIHLCCGLHAVDARSDLNRVWRDFHFASQHALLTPGTEIPASTLA